MTSVILVLSSSFLILFSNPYAFQTESGFTWFSTGLSWLGLQRYRACQCACEALENFVLRTRIQSAYTTPFSHRPCSFWPLDTIPLISDVSFLKHTVHTSLLSLVPLYR
ncbi:hypothetical protein BDV93DRAFT_23789 [Ceratobasidium sp. AG-I]|nr:hypothetical protein BDV93DRAFT_23789 [Ceratobasidium sp. AG-I]